ncbi:hypothetical protein BGZ94_003244 [Podila epigama]|nr:hypothetical protein BGZ94_003244 [Podila epigama]
MSTHVPKDQSENEQDDEDPDTGMEFRLFATQDAPTKITLVQQPTQDVSHLLEATYWLKRQVDDSPGSTRSKHIQEAAIDARTILEQAKIPWARTFFEHKVIHVPFRQPNTSATRKTKPSRAKREWAKKLKSGEVSIATAKATARPVKVAESYGRKPYMERKGLDRNTLVVGTDHYMAAAKELMRAPRRGTSSVRGFSKGRWAPRGGHGCDSRGGAYHPATRNYKEKKIHNDRMDSTTPDSTAVASTVTNVPSKRTENSSQDNLKVAKKQKSEPKTRSNIDKTSNASSATSASNSLSQTQTPASPHATSSSIPTPTQPSKKPKVPKAKKDAKPMSKIDNIMAMLMSK